MGFFPKFAFAFGLAGSILVSYILSVQTGNGRQDPQTKHPSKPLSKTDTVFTMGAATHEIMRSPQPTDTSVTRRLAQQVEKKSNKKPIIRVGREPVQLGKRTLRILQKSRPPKIHVMTPTNPSYVETEWITVRVKSEPRAYLRVGERPLLETARGVYAGKIQLQPGKNQLTVHARDISGNTATTTLTITWIDEKRMRRTQDRLRALMAQLDEIQKISREIDTRTEELIHKINTTQDADTINRLSKERQEINQTKLMIQSEIQQAIQAIDSLLAKRE